MGKNRKYVWMTIIILITIEQAIKVVINNNFLESNVPIIGSCIFFNPMFNRDYSWLNSMLQLGIGKWVHILAVAVILVLAFLFYRSTIKKKTEALLIDIAFTFLFAGGICSLIDKIFWNGSLDYIQLKGYFTFDLKDVYINVFNGMLILMFLIDYKGIRKGTTIK